MRKRINWLFVLLTIVAIIVTTLLATIVNYTVLKQEVIDDLRIYAQTLKKTVYADQKAENGQVKIATPLRITLVDTDGAVLYDSEADEASMGNQKTARRSRKLSNMAREIRYVIQRRSETIRFIMRCVWTMVIYFVWLRIAVVL